MRMNNAEDILAIQLAMHGIELESYAEVGDEIYIVTVKKGAPREKAYTITTVEGDLTYVKHMIIGSHNTLIKPIKEVKDDSKD